MYLLSLSQYLILIKRMSFADSSLRLPVLTSWEDVALGQLYDHTTGEFGSQGIDCSDSVKVIS